MKKSSLLVLSLLAVTSISLSACGSNSEQSSISSGESSVSSESSSVGGNSSSVSSQNSGTSSSSESTTPAKTYVVYVQETAHVTVEADKQLAAAGETVNLTITPDSGYEVTSVSVNDEKIKGTSFVMPSRGVFVKVVVELVVQGDYMLGGDISETLVKNVETGMYEARNVKITSDSRVSFVIKNKALSVTQVNAAKSFADIHLPTDNKAGFDLTGGCTYDFFYDPTDPETPCIVKRVKIDQLPATDTQLETLFAGTVKGETTVNPDGVSKVTYTSTERNDSYTWELYSDNSSLATVTTNAANARQKGVVYKSIDNNVYTVVDSYVENHSGHSITYTEAEDRTRFSGKYDIVSSKDYGHEDYQRTLDEASRDVNTYSHTMQSLDFDIMYAYRTGFVNAISDDKYTYDIKVNSEWAADGETFTTVVDSWVTVEAAGTSYTDGTSYHNEFDVTMTFTKAGALLSLVYDELDYDSTQYDIKNQKFVTGGEDNPKSEKYVTATYTYGTPKEGKPTFDTTPYFISAINSLEVVDSKGNKAIVNRNDSIEMFNTDAGYLATSSKYINMDYTPTTALDTWQYGIISSSNTDVIMHKYDEPVQYPFEFVGKAEGTSTLTIGNHTASTGVKGTVNAVVPSQANNVKSVYAYVVYPYENTNWDSSTTGKIYAGFEDDVKLAATLSNNTTDQYADLKVDSSNNTLLAVTYDRTTGYMHLDATGARNITQATNITITIDASYDDSYRNGSKCTLSVKIMPAPHLVESVVGTWDYVDEDGSVAAKGFTASMTFNEDGTGSITANDGSDQYVISFKYTFNKSKQLIEASEVTATKNGESFGMATVLYFDIDSINTGYIGVYCLVELSYDHDDSGDIQINAFELFGSTSIDSETGDTHYHVEDFKPHA